MKPERPLLLIFVKHPEPGKTKTRLARGIGEEKALEVYRELLSFTLEVTCKVEVDKVVFYGNSIPEEDLWSRANYPREPQIGNDLGDRMAHAFNWGFERGYGQILIIGSDNAKITAQIITEAVQQLHTHEFVIGPALDGGYYLLGMSHFFPEVFQGKSWSTDTVYRETINEINAAGFTYYQLPVLSDVDTIEDLKGTFLEHFLPQSSASKPPKPSS